MDEWAAWFADRRHGSDAEQLQRTLEFVLPIRDDIIRHAGIGEGDTVLDVGCGDGLIAFAAAERVGPRGSVIFSDVSADLLAHCRRRSAGLGLADRCRFVRASASDLSAITDNEVDAVTLRSVLIY
jgi:arsenite methyltransferase